MNRKNASKETPLKSSASTLCKWDILIYFLCLLFIFLWFKDSLPPLRKIPISRVFPMVGMSALLVIQLFLKIKSGGKKRNIRFSQTHFLIVAIIVLAIALRIPFLMHNYGLFNSDDAIPALMSKHISEGKLPPVYFYGQLYMGSFAEHLYAILILLFGYSPLLLKVSPLIFFLAFLALQFIFLRQLFSIAFALAVSLFYCLPIGHLHFISMDNSHKDPLVLLFGISLIYVAYQIYYHNRAGLIPGYGLLLGLGFWTHQITISFILTSFIIVICHIKLNVKKYFQLFAYSLIGLLPVLMMEFYWNFPLVRYLTRGKTGSISFGKIHNTFRLLLHLITREVHPINIVFLIFILAGFIVLFIPSFRAKKILPQSVFSLYFLVFLVIYWLSDFSQYNAVRYLYPLYLCIPVLLLAPLFWLKSRLKYPLMGALLLSILFFSNLKSVFQDFQVIKDSHNKYKDAIALLRDTGQQTWNSEFWTAYLITALSGEDPVVDSYTVNRYYPYRLAYYNSPENENLIFISKDVMSQRFIHMLDSFGIAYKKQEMNDCRLIYDIQSPVFMQNLIAPVPKQLPAIEIIQLKYAKGYLHVKFRNKGTSKNLVGFRIHFEIPGYSSMVRDFPLQKEEARTRIPFPRINAFKLKYVLDYRGLKIPHSEGEIMCNPQPSAVKEKRGRMVYLSGVGPNIAYEGREKLKICEREAHIEINRRLDKNNKLRFSLFSPFEFSDPKWYGQFAQELDVSINKHFVSTHRLEYGYNVIEFDLHGLDEALETNIVSLKFKYHYPFRFSPFLKAAALIEKIEIF